MDLRVHISNSGRSHIRPPQIIYKRTKQEHAIAIRQSGPRLLIHGTGAAVLALAFEARGCIAFTNGPERRADGSRHIDGPLMPLLRRGLGAGTDRPWR